MLRPKVRRVLQRLREGCPAPMPVAVRVVNRPKSSHWGYAGKRKGSFSIELHRACDAVQVDTLIHEWAHCLSWGADAIDHGDEFGKAWARAYRVGTADET